MHTWLLVYTSLLFCLGFVDGTSNTPETNMIDPIQHKVSIHFESKQFQEDEKTRIEQISLEYTKFNCQVPQDKIPLPKLYPAIESNKTVETLLKFDRSQRFSPLSESEMQSISNHFSILNNRCHLDLVSSRSTFHKRNFESKIKKKRQQQQEQNTCINFVMIIL